MGNRCVITTKENWKHCGIGVYLHWNGGRDSVEAFLQYCEMKGYSNDDFARICQVVGNFFGGSLSLYIDSLWNLDRDNGDNGVYIIENWKIVDRIYFDGIEQNEYERTEMLLAIDEKMPEDEQIGDYIKAEEVDISELNVGDAVVFLDWNGKIRKANVLGIGEDRTVNGRYVKGVPYIGIYCEEDPASNANNYLKQGEVRKMKIE